MTREQRDDLAMLAERPGGATITLLLAHRFGDDLVYGLIEPGPPTKHTINRENSSGASPR
jgi:hypothetical protein